MGNAAYEQWKSSVLSSNKKNKAKGCADISILIYLSASILHRSGDR